MAISLDDVRSWQDKDRADAAIKYQHVNLLDRAYVKGDTEGIYTILQWMESLSDEWIREGYADTAYMRELARAFAQRAIDDDDQELTSYFLDFKEKVGVDGSEHGVTGDDMSSAGDPFGEFMLEDMDLSAWDAHSAGFLADGPGFEGDLSRAPIYYSCGMILEFGRYRSSSTGAPEPVRWIILDREEDKALLMAAKVLDIKPFNDYYDNMSWENCSLRQWLSEDFYDEAFADSEKELIIPARLSNGKGTGIHGAVPEEIYHDTFDKVFLLSADEIKEYLAETSAIKAEGTGYVDAMDIPSVIGGRYRWWGRSMGINSSAACVVDYSWVNGYGENINSGGIGVRPAMWIRLPLPGSASLAT